MKNTQVIWQQITLERFPVHTIDEWLQSSRLHHHVVGLLKTWRSDSWLLRRADWFGNLFILLIFGLSPLISTTWIGLLLLSCFGFWILLTLSDRDRIGLTPIHVVVLAYWIITTVATALSPVRMAALDGWIKFTLYVVLFMLMARVLRSPRLRNWVITVYLYAALLVSVVGLRQWFFGASALATWVDVDSSLAGTTRVYSYLGNPNLLAAYLVPAVTFSAIALFAWNHWGAKILALVMFMVNSACLVLTFSRGGWIGMVISGFAALILLIHWFSIRWPKFWRIWTLPIVLGGSTAVLTSAVLTIQPLYERVFSMFVGREDSSNNFRINVWMAVIDMIQARPIIGIGPGNVAFNQVYPFYQQPGFTALSAYSILLETAVETGIIGLVCFLWLLLVTFNQGWIQLQRLRRSGQQEGLWLIGAIATMCGMLAHGIVDTVWYRPQVSTLWWLMLALVASYYLVPTADINPMALDRDEATKPS